MSAYDERVYSVENGVCLSLQMADETDVRTFDFHGSLLELPIERKFGDVASVQAYVTQVLGLEQVREKYARASLPCTVRHNGKLTRHARYFRSSETIEMNESRDGRWAMREMVVLHELAHHISPESGHGRAFRTSLCNLLNWCIGPEIALILGSKFWEEFGE